LICPFIHIKQICMCSHYNLKEASSVLRNRGNCIPFRSTCVRPRFYSACIGERQHNATETKTLWIRQTKQKENLANIRRVIRNSKLMKDRRYNLSLVSFTLFYLPVYWILCFSACIWLFLLLIYYCYFHYTNTVENLTSLKIGTGLSQKWENWIKDPSLYFIFYFNFFYIFLFCLSFRAIVILDCFLLQILC
jgi:hypothetical protein